MLSISDCFRAYLFGYLLRGGIAILGGLIFRPTNAVYTQWIYYLVTSKPFGTF